MLATEASDEAYMQHFFLFDCCCFCLKNNLLTPLHLAATCGFLGIAKLLVMNGAEVDSRDLEERTPMHKYQLLFCSAKICIIFIASFYCRHLYVGILVFDSVFVFYYLIFNKVKSEDY